MPYLIDGNNVMAQSVGWHRNPPGARKRLIHDLVRLVAARRVKVKVVFDGLPDTEFPEGCKFKGVLILYARRGSDADSRIKELMTKSSYVRDLVMVSSDRALARFAARKGARVMPSHEFRILLQESRDWAEANDAAGESQIGVEEWMEFFEKKRP
jgi:predicted RNA-binding protein with PIN domain